MRIKKYHNALEKLLVSYGLNEKEASVLWSAFHSVSYLATEESNKAVTKKVAAERSGDSCEKINS